MYDEYGALVIPPGQGKIRFGRQELINILIAMGVLIFAFFMILLPGWDAPTMVVLEALGIATLAVITGFLLHEMAHKFVAQKYGAWAEFRIFPLGLVLALVFSFLGFVFAAPGAVYIQGRIGKRENGLISVAGPATNLGFGALCVALGYLFPISSDLAIVLNLVGSINLFLALFNLIPITPLDGSKVVRWNLPIYLIVVVASGALLLISWGYITL
jgi:Zn-dependent protease